jgi:glyoxylase-like metal-dependent hydrolase (beta-lactamase superfamily II)
MMKNGEHRMTTQNLQVTHQREIPHELLDNVWMWSLFSEEKGLFFNGYAVKTLDGLLIIDPPAATDAVFEALSPLGKPTMVFITNRDHERESDAFRRFFNIQVAAHESDAPLMEIRPELTFKEWDVLRGGLQVFHLSHQKSPGETAFYQPESRMLILGDALLGKPAGQLTMLPEDKYADKALAFQSLKQSLSRNLEIEILLVGDGEPILQNAAQVLADYFGTNG